MFILEDKRKKPIARLAEQPSVMWHLFAPGEAQKYPMWSLIDDASPTWFSSDRMEELITDLERLRSAPEIVLRQLKWKQSLDEGIARLEAEPGPARRSRKTGSETLDWMRESARLAQQQPPLYPESLQDEAVVPFVGSIIELARRCRHIKGFLGHDPFAGLS